MVVAFYVSRFDFRVNLFLPLVFTAGNLLPQQVVITPLYRLYPPVDLPGITMSGKLYDSALGLVLIHVAFQSGFCAFVLSNYMRSLPHELTEAALVDGASVWRLYWQIVLPLCKPALATLLSIWIYNDFFWAIVLISTGENNQRPRPRRQQGLNWTNPARHPLPVPGAQPVSTAAMPSG